MTVSRDLITSRLLSVLPKLTVVVAGGQWDMVVNLIEKYGVVPKSAYPESHASSNSRAMNRFLTSLLRQYARELREQQGDTQAAQRVYLQHIYRALCIYMGTPPQSFSWRYYDKDGAFHVIPDLTPVSFYRDHARVSVKDYVSLIHDPRNPYGALYSVKYLGNVLGGLRPVVRHLNVDMADIRRYCVQQLEAQRPVWFGCDSGTLGLARVFSLLISLLSGPHHQEL